MLTQPPISEHQLLKELSDQVQAAQRHLFNVAQDAFPAGKRIAWMRSGHKQVGTIVDVGGVPGDILLRVHNPATGKTYAIHLYDYLYADQSGLEAS